MKKYTKEKTWGQSWSTSVWLPLTSMFIAEAIQSYRPILKCKLIWEYEYLVANPHFGCCLYFLGGFQASDN